MHTHEWSEPAHPAMRLGEVDKIETIDWEQPEGFENYTWTAWYAGDEPDDTGHMAYGYGSTQLRAVTDLQFRFPREDWP